MIALGDEIDGEPVGDEEPDGVGETLGEDDAPGLGVFEKGLVREAGLAGGAGVGAVGEDVFPFFFGEARMGFRRVIEPAKERDPEQAEDAGYEERGTPIVENPIDSKDDEGGERAANGGAAIVDGDSPAAFALGEPFGDGFGGAGPVGGFARAEEEAEGGEAGEAGCEGCGHSGEGVEADGEGQTEADADAVQDAAGDGLANRVRRAEGDDEQREGGVVPVELGLDVRSEDGKRLAVNVVDDGGEEERSRDPPAEVWNWFGHAQVTTLL